MAITMTSIGRRRVAVAVLAWTTVLTWTTACAGDRNQLSLAVQLLENATGDVQSREHYWYSACMCMSALFLIKVSLCVAPSIYIGEFSGMLLSYMYVHFV